MQKNFKVLFIVNGSNAVTYYRMLLPYNNIKKNGYEVYATTLDAVPINPCNVFNIIHYHISLLLIEEFRKYIDENLNKIKFVCDIDDYWIIPKTNPYYKTYIIGNYIEEYIPLMSAITTTTDYLANHIRMYNDNVFVCPNAVDLNIEQYQNIKQTQSKRLRFGFVGGVSHYNDIKQTKGFTRFLKNELKNDIQIVLAGFDYGNDDQRLCYWNYFEKLITDDYKILNKQHQDFLMTFSKLNYYTNENYRRIYSHTIDNYMNIYNNVDVLLVPLYDDEFNKCKSELKMIEAGTANIPVICSPIGIYNSFNDDEVYKCDNGAKNWSDAIKELLYDKNLRNTLSYNLSNKIKKEYNLTKINEIRIKIYKEICS